MAAHLTIKLAHLRVVKMNVALYDHLCDVIEVVNRHTRFWLDDTRCAFMTDALRYIHGTDDLAAVVESEIRVHKDRLVQEIDRNRKLRRHVNVINQYWYSKAKDGAVMPGCSSSAIMGKYRHRTDVNKDLPETVPVTELCNQLLHTYYYKNDSDVVDVLPLLLTSEESPAPRKCPPVTDESDACVRRREPVPAPKQPISVRLLALSSTLTPGGDTDVFDLPATAAPEPDEDTTTRAPCTVLSGTDQEARCQQTAKEMEQKRQRMSQWLTDKALSNQHICGRERKASMMDKLLPKVKRQRTMQTVPRHEQPRTILRILRKQNHWAVDNCGVRSGYKRHG